MPDPNAHADDTKSPAKLKTMPLPAFWWLNPWSEAIAWHRRAENGFATHMKTCDELRETYIALSRCQIVKGDMTAEIDQLRKDLADTAGAVSNLKQSCEQHYKTAGEQVARRVAAENALADARDELKQAYENLEKVRKATGMVLEGDRLSMAGTVTRVEAVVQYLIDARDANTRLKEAGNEMRESRDRFAYALQHNAELDQLNGPLIQKVSRAKRKVLAEDKTTGKKLLAPKAKKKGGSK